MKKRYILKYFLILTTLFVLLLLAILIPDSRIREHTTGSSKYFLKHRLFEREYADREYAVVDNLADCYLISVLCGIDVSENKLRAIFMAPYYQDENRNINESLAVALKEKLLPNQSYARYWHGGIIFVKPLLLFGDIVFVRRAIGALLFLAFGAVLLLNILYRQYAFAGIYLIGCVFLRFSYVSKCVEYAIPILLLNMVMLILTIRMRKCGKTFDMPGFMLLSGCIVSFFDFLTVETLFFTVPYFYYISVRSDKLFPVKEQFAAAKKSELKALLLSGISFINSYAMTFLVKWGICALLDKSSFPLVWRQVMVRVRERTLAGALENNIKLLLHPGGKLPDSYMAVYAALFLLLLFGVIAATYGMKNLRLFMMGLLALIPYLRYAVLKNHSRYHYFFTYRAQLIVCMFLLFCIFDILLRLRKRFLLHHRGCSS